MHNSRCCESACSLKSPPASTSDKVLCIVASFKAQEDFFTDY